MNQTPTSKATKILFTLVADAAHIPRMVIFVKSFMGQVTSCLVGGESCSLNRHELVPKVTSVKHVWACG